jgi:hypothetical protein
MNGLKVLGATKWKRLRAMEYERKFELEVLGTKDGKLIFNAVRTCDKDGEFYGENDDEFSSEDTLEEFTWAEWKWEHFSKL